MNLSLSKKVLKYRWWQLKQFFPAFYNASSYGWHRRNRLFLEEYSRYGGVALTREQMRIKSELGANGVAVTHIGDLIENGSRLLSDLQHEVSALVKVHEGEVMYSKKKFLSYFYFNFFEGQSEQDSVDLESPLFKFWLHPTLLAIVCEHYGMFARLRFASGNVTVPVSTSSHPEHSQRWHRDPGIRTTCKVFLYLNDVDASTGPFMCIAGAQIGGRNARICPHRFFGIGSYYPTERAVEKSLKRYGAQDAVRACTGRAGTVIFCNTTTLHKGGFSTDNARIMLTAFYDYRPRGIPAKRRFVSTKRFKEKYNALPSLAQYALQ